MLILNKIDNFDYWADTLEKLNYNKEMEMKLEKINYVFWQDENMWLGYLEEFPDYVTQGKTKKELKENLKDIYSELNSGNIPCVRKVAELEVE